MHKTKLVLLTAAALLAITSGAEAAKVKRSSGFSMGRPASVKPVQKPAPVTTPVPGRPAASTQAAPQTAPAAWHSVIRVLLQKSSGENARSSVKG